MRYRSTREASDPVAADTALRLGAAPDGGLYLPETLPSAYKHADASRTLAGIASDLLTLLFADSRLADAVPGICETAFDIPAPLIQPDPARPQLNILELFHGPTGAFKDFGARFLFRCFDRLASEADPITVLAATSGDTGGAVGCAAEGANHARAVILYPRGRISDFQERQLCCWSEPVMAMRVDADFDACQALVKAAFADRSMSRRYGLTSANSINIGRFLPQMAYWARSARELHDRTGQAPGLIIPTGNLGNAFAAILARALGEPIGPIVLATNANSTLYDWHVTGDYRARASIATLANAMDVGAPSNFERLAALETGGIHAVMRVDDANIRERIRAEFGDCGYIACPHTATGLEAFARLLEADRADRPWIIAATAHPFKFADIVAPLIGQDILPPPALAAVFERGQSVHDIPADLDALDAALAATSSSATFSHTAG